MNSTDSKLRISQLVNFRCFIDTNILVYAINRAEQEKSRAARQLLKALTSGGNGIISEQVLLECFNVLVNKLKVERSDAREIVSKLSRLEVQFSDETNLRSAIDLAVLNQLSIWDAHIVASAIKSRSKYLITEDLQDGREFQGLRVCNPFKP